ncbi:MAG: adenosylcobinamide-GDP ribazoletransferase [Acidobacteriota bacterium]
MRSFFIAVQFLTRLQVPGHRDVEGREMPRATTFFPLVGLLIGLSTALAIEALSLLWPALLAVLLALALEALLTGGLHEDAVADFFDAFGGGWTREDILRILKDSRLGSYGALALFLAVLLRAGSLLELSGAELLAASALAGGLGRFMTVLFMAALPPAQDRPGLASDVGQEIGGRHVVAAGLWLTPALAAMAWLQPAHLALAAVLVALAAGWVYRTLRRRLGGSTGDALGCVCYLTQVAVLLAAAARLPTP